MGRRIGREWGGGLVGNGAVEGGTGNALGD